MPSPHRDLSKALAALFSSEEWYRWLRTEHPDISDLVSRNNAVELFEDSVDCLERFGCLDDDFFAKLTDLRPNQRDVISNIRERFGKLEDWENRKLGVAWGTERHRAARIMNRRALTLYILAAVFITSIAGCVMIWIKLRECQSTTLPPQAFIEACQSSFLNTEDDLQIVDNFEDLRIAIREHLVECRALMQQLAP